MSETIQTSLVLPFGEQEVLKPFVRKLECTEYSYYINDELGAPAEYQDMFNTLRNATEADVVLIYLNTPGGRLDTGIQMINAMRACEGKVITILDGQVQSMGALLFLSGHELVVQDNCILMFHNYSGGMVGKGHEQIAELKATTVWVSRLMKNICHPFLTHDEIEAILDGRDIWIESTEIKARLKRMSDAQTKKSDKAKEPKKAVPRKKPKVATLDSATPVSAEVTGA